MKANTICGQRQYAFVSQFNYIREAGTEGEEKAACRIEKELSEIAEKWGQGELQIRREPFEIETWQVDEAVFTVTEPYEKHTPSAAASRQPIPLRKAWRHHSST